MHRDSWGWLNETRWAVSNWSTLCNHLFPGLLETYLFIGLSSVDTASSITMGLSAAHFGWQLIPLKTSSCCTDSAAGVTSFSRQALGALAGYTGFDILTDSDMGCQNVSQCDDTVWNWFFNLDMKSTQITGGNGVSQVWSRNHNHNHDSKLKWTHSFSQLAPKHVFILPSILFLLLTTCHKFSQHKYNFEVTIRAASTMHSHRKFFF